MSTEMAMAMKTRRIMWVFFIISVSNANVNQKGMEEDEESPLQLLNDL